MSDMIAHEALQRMNLNVMAIEPTRSNFMADMQKMSKTDPVEAQARFMDQRRAELCAAYGFENAPQKKPFAFAGGLAIIPVSGMLINRFGQSYGYVTGYNFIRQQRALAEADDEVLGILYDVNSYGGEAAGCFECAAGIYDGRDKKPSMSYVDSAAYSAGMAIASGASKIVCTPSGGVGSIGVVVMHMDVSKALSDFGYKITFIHFGEHKVDGNMFEPLPASVKKDIQTSVDKSGEKFVALMAKHRNLDAKVIRDTEARTYRAEDALALGLIDAIATPEEAVQAFLGELSGSTVQPRKKEVAMTTKTEEPGASTAAPAPAPAAPAAAPAVAAAPAGASVADVAKAQAEARTAERARVAGITGSEEAKANPGLANHFAMNTDMSVDDAKAALKAAGPAAAAAGTTNNAFKQAMDTSQHPNVGAEAAGGGEDGGENLTAAQRILKDQACVVGRKAEAAKK